MIIVNHDIYIHAYMYMSGFVCIYARVTKVYIYIYYKTNI